MNDHRTSADREPNCIAIVEIEGGEKAVELCNWYGSKGWGWCRASGGRDMWAYDSDMQPLSPGAPPVVRVLEWASMPEAPKADHLQPEEVTDGLVDEYARRFLRRLARTGYGPEALRLAAKMEVAAAADMLIDAGILCRPESKGGLTAVLVTDAKVSSGDLHYWAAQRDVPPECRDELKRAAETIDRLLAQ